MTEIQPDFAVIAGFEPATSSLGSKKSSIVSDTDKQLTETPSSVCTRVCTSEPKNVHGDTAIDSDLAAVIGAWPTLPRGVKERILVGGRPIKRLAPGLYSVHARRSECIRRINVI